MQDYMLEISLCFGPIPRRIFRSDKAYWIFRFAIFAGIGWALSGGDLIIGVIGALIISMAIEVEEAYERGYRDGKRDSISN